MQHIFLHEQPSQGSLLFAKLYNKSILKQDIVFKLSLQVSDGFKSGQIGVLTIHQCNLYLWSYNLNLNAV